MIIEFNCFSHEGVQDTLSIVYSIINIIRYVIPIILIVITTLDISKKIINPEDKEGQQKILIRTIAAIIIFFIPTFINLFLNFAGITIPNINTNPTTNTKNNDNNEKNKEKETKKEKELSNLEITNCPSLLSTYYNGNKITLNTNIDSSYSKDIIWSVTEGKNFVNLNASNDRKSAEVTFKNAYSKGKVTIYVTAGGSNSYCEMFVDKEKIENLAYTNCPPTSTIYYVGDTVSLTTNIKDSYNGDIKWYSDNDSAVKITTNSNLRSATIKILDQPKLGYVIVKTAAGYNNIVCLLSINAVKELKITNCPSENNVYHVGDTIILNSNIPSFYKRDPIWQSTETPDAFIIKPTSNGRSAEIKIISVPENGYGYIGLGADSKGTSCLINIK